MVISTQQVVGIVTIGILAGIDRPTRHLRRFPHVVRGVSIPAPAGQVPAAWGGGRWDWIGGH